MSDLQVKLNETVEGLGTAKFEAPVISVAEVRSRVAAKDASLVILDIRTEEETNISTIPGAILKKDYDQQPELFSDKQVVAFCTVGYCSGKT